MKKLLLLASLVTVTFFGNAQNAITQRTCGTPALAEEYEIWMQAKIQEFKSLQQSGRVQTHYDIPVVVHVIHSNEAVGVLSNISVAQINSQITVLNEDFRRQNADTTLVPAAFKPFIADVDINFHLATVDPSGNPTTGIDRISYQSKGWTAPGAGYSKTYVDGTIKPGSIWPTSQYLNMWVMSLGGGLLGYATFPPNSTLSGLSGVGNSNTDGVVILHSAFGKVGTVSAPYHKGRSATHEVGHYLGLRHIWGDGTCPSTNNDYCNDTPPQKGQNFGCPTYPLIAVNNGQGWYGPSCTATAPGSMFMNFMDYTDDMCMQMFSNDQVTRMQTAMANSPMRNQLSVTGIAQNSARLQNVNVYPNPTKGQLTVSAPTLQVGTDFTINVINILGKTVYHQTVEATNDALYQLDLGSLNSGLYILELRNEQGTSTQRIEIDK